jgi:enamine deaminase RidA (YjgF/YER057c/UK114 family)
MFTLSVAGVSAIIGGLIVLALAPKQSSSSKEIERFDVDSRFTDACRYNDLVFISGQVGLEGDIEQQTKRALSDVDAALAKAGTDKSRILELTIWLADMADYDGMNAVYDKWIIPGKPPCRACIHAKLAKPEWKIEVRVIAASK